MFRLPFDHIERMDRTFLSLQGLSVGDALGQCFFYPTDTAESRIINRELPPPIWYYTDDTEMAISVAENLQNYGTIDKDRLAAAFAKRYEADWHRGYGGTAHEILREIGQGTPWQKAAQAAFSGMGSKGNGAAMRVSPLGAYFADDLKRAKIEALESASPTHAHPDGQAGAVAIAVATALFWQNTQTQKMDGGMILEEVLRHTPMGETYQKIQQAIQLYEQEFSVQGAAKVLGSGYQILSSDTVPFSLFCAALHQNNFTEALWATLLGLGDRDTTCAMVGGMISMTKTIIPPDWIAAREALPSFLPMK